MYEKSLNYCITLDTNTIISLLLFYLSISLSLIQTNKQKTLKEVKDQEEGET